MATTTDNGATDAPAETAVQPTVSTNSTIEPAVTVINPATQEKTEVGQTTVTTSPMVADAAANAAVATGTATTTDTSTMTAEGVPNGLPPAAPGVQLQPPNAVIEFREWVHKHVKNTVHDGDEELHKLIGAIEVRLHSAYPLKQ